MHQNGRRGPALRPPLQLLWERSSNALSALLSQPCSLALAIAQVIESCAARVRSSHHLYPVDPRRVKEERPLHADAMRGDAPYREGRARSASADAEDGALEGLYAFAFSFDDAYVYLDGVARTQLGDVRISL
mgnify:CR=1 FL=1